MERTVTGGSSTGKMDTAKPSTLAPTWEKPKNHAEDLMVIVSCAWSKAEGQWTAHGLRYDIQQDPKRMLRQERLSFVHISVTTEGLSLDIKLDVKLPLPLSHS